MDTMPILKPCPFCGSTSVVLVDLTVRCGNCTAVGPFGVNPQQAIKRWNQRTEGVINKAFNHPKRKPADD